MNTFKRGFTLIELMVVVAIIGIFAVFAVPNFTRYLAKAKRAEAYMYLNSLYAAQKAYWAEHGTYTDNLNGPGGLGWKPEGYEGSGNQKFNYTYGFPSGGEGVGYFTGKLGAPSSALSQGYANQNQFLAIAAGDIDGDGTPDIIGVDHNNNIVILQDDLS